MMKFRAFTLAEVLITLGIIGVVAAMTIPALISNYNERVTVTKVKKMYSVLSQAVKLAMVENGEVNQWDLGDTYNIESAEKLWLYLKPHLRIAHECGDNKDCYSSAGVKSLSGNNYGANYNDDTKYFKLITADGSVLWFRTGSKCSTPEGGYQNHCGIIWYDIDGVKGANTFGKDIFVFVLLADGVVPYKQCEYRSSPISCSKNEISKYSGLGCSYYIINNGNMNYLH